MCAARPETPGGGGRRLAQGARHRARSSTSGSPRPPSSWSSSWPSIWIPLRRSRLGLSIYAVGSNQLAAFRSGVSVGRTKVAAYALTGLFAALGGPEPDREHGHRDAGARRRTRSQSVAAIVLGGVSLAGGRGGVFGPIVAVIILALIRTDMTFLGINPNLATVVQGAILIGVVMVGSLIQLRRARA